MTYSIVAYDPDEPAWGVAVASKFPAVGAVVPWAQAGAGAVATQSYANVSFGPRGLALMEEGLNAEETLKRLLEDDSDREKRQVGIVDANGEAVTFTGKECHPWAGGVTGAYYAIQGNILTSEEVIQAMERSFNETKGDLPTRLYAALLAGDQAGGDKRGKQSAAIYVAKPGGSYGGTTDRWIDYRVDDHPDPVARLGELLHLHQLYFGESSPEDRLPLQGKVLEQLQALMQNAGYYQGPLSGKMDSMTKTALDAFIGNENFEERCSLDQGWIDRPVFEYLQKRFGG